MNHTTAIAVPGLDPMAPHLLAAATFLNSLASDNTVDAYRTDLRVYFEWCYRWGIDPLNARRLHVQAFAKYLADERGNASATVSRRIGTLTVFYDLCVEDRYCQANPCARVRVKRVHLDVSRMVWLDRFELGTMLRAAKASRQPADWALVCLLGVLGLRVQEACDIDMEDLSTTGMGYRMLRTVGKNDKPNLRALPVPTWEAIDRASAGRNLGPLLLRRDKTRMTRRSAATVLTRLAKAARIDKRVHPHALRRSFATLALMAGEDVRSIAQAMGHASTRTTLIYDSLGVEPHAQAQHKVAALLASAS